jgi:serine protease AprX
MRGIRTRAAGAVLAAALGITPLLSASPASATETAQTEQEKSLLGGLLGGTVGLVGGVVGTVGGLVGGVLHAGWDDGATTDPTPMSLVNDAINADTMWRHGFDGSGVGVAVIDSGVAPVQGLNGPGKVVNGPDLSFESQSDVYRHLDTYGHGTHMAGITAGNDGRSGSFRGVAPGARVISIKAGTRSGAVDVSQVIAGIDWVVAHRNDPGLNIRVLNLSFGTDGLQDYEIDPLVHAVESAWHNGIVVVVAGGNDGATHPSLANPARDPYVLAVGAVDLAGTPSSLDDAVAPFSSRGDGERNVDLLAPGVSLQSLRTPGSTVDDEHPGARVGERYFRGSGTSQAAAVVSGAAALLFDARPDLTPDKVKALLEASATPLVNVELRAQGAGRIDVERAYRSLVPPTYRQTFARSTGTGSLELARGTSHLSDDEQELVGERDIMGRPWDGATWAPLSSQGTAWSGGRWNGEDWTGASWAGWSWTGVSWEGKSWTGKSWTGKSWTSDDWAGKSWTGKSWTGKSWTGKSWTGKSWTAGSWLSM